MDKAWRRVRGVAAFGVLAMGACSGKLDLLGEMNSGGSGGSSGSKTGGSSGSAPESMDQAGGADGDGSGGAAGSGPLTAGTGPLTAGSGGVGGAPSPPDPPDPVPVGPNYQLTGSWPRRPTALATKPGTLTYTKITIHDRFLAESCAIGDYNNDGLPDVSSGRRWYEQQPGGTAESITFSEHIFRGGHDDLPRNGDGPEIEIDTGVSDDRADYAYDVDDDGFTDIINTTAPNANDFANPNPQPAPQPHATAYWYKNPGPAQAGVTQWPGYLIHTDFQGEQHAIADIDSDGKPELVGACKSCNPNERKGYYKAQPNNPTGGWTFHAVSALTPFPFGGVGAIHGIGVGDVNGDGKPDLLDRVGAYIDVAAAQPNVTICPAPGCGLIQQNFFVANGEVEGPSHIYASDLDGDGDADVVAADSAYLEGLSWYEQTSPGQFTRHRFMGHSNERDLFGVYFTGPIALELVDMDGDGVSDVVTGKMRFVMPNGYGVPDLLGAPVLYVFKTVRGTPGPDGSPITLRPVLVDNMTGIGRQIAVGHINTDGIPDICVATKLGLNVYLGH